MGKTQSPPNLQQQGGGCVYTPYVYDRTGRVSNNFYNTACGQEYVGIPFHGARCKNCDRTVVKAAA
jgi:hypothetical protein